MISRGPNTAHGRGSPAVLGALTTAINSMGAGTYLDWTGSTNVQAITDTTGPGGTAMAWLESVANLYLTNWPGKLCWDSARKQVIVVGTCQGYISDSPPGTHAAAVFLDVTTGVFSKVWNPYGENTGHVYDVNASGTLNGKMYNSAYGSAFLHECDLATRVWATSKNISSLSIGAVRQLEVFPDLGASGSVLLLGDTGKLCRWDIATDALSTIGTYDGIAAYPSIHYVPTSAAVVFGGGTTGTKFRKIDSAGAVTTISTSLPSGLTGTGASIGAPMIADPAGRAKSWAFLMGGNAFSLDHVNGTWTDHGAMPEGISTCPVAAVHEHSAAVFLEGAGRQTGTSLSQVWLYKVA